MWIKSFTANGSVLDALTLNRGSEMMYVYSRTNEILVSVRENYRIDMHHQGREGNTV